LKRTIATFAFLASSTLWGQTGSAPLTFEVASIKPTAADFHGTMFQLQPGGGLRITGANLKTLLAYMYDVREFQISGGPGWINSERYDIVAKPERATGSDSAPADPGKLTDDQRKTFLEQTRQRMQSLLAERFHLSVHRETKEAPVYALAVSKSGSKLQPAKGGGPDKMRMGRAEITGEAVEIQMLVMPLANILGRPVVDKTGLAGKFDFKLEWTPDPNQSFGNFGPPPPGAEAPPPGDPSGPSIFTAVQEQLGLRLESEKGPVEMVVIDRVEKPSEN
jgi:bla regulator protein blaR1